GKRLGSAVGALEVVGGALVVGEFDVVDPEVEGGIDVVEAAGRVGFDVFIWIDGFVEEELHLQDVGRDGAALRVRERARQKLRVEIAVEAKVVGLPFGGRLEWTLQESARVVVAIVFCSVFVASAARARAFARWDRDVEAYGGQRARAFLRLEANAAPLARVINGGGHG